MRLRDDENEIRVLGLEDPGSNSLDHLARLIGADEAAMMAAVPLHDRQVQAVDPPRRARRVGLLDDLRVE
jgi:hypothetical protein